MLVDQVYIFGWSILTGVILGVLFDVFRGFRWEGIRDIWVYIQDIIFWIVSAVVVIASAFLINQGELRGYMLIGYFLGAGFYMLLFSTYVLGIFKFINASIRKVFGLLGKFVNNAKERIANNLKSKKEHEKVGNNLFHRKSKKLNLKQEI